MCKRRHADQDNSTLLRAWGGKGKTGTPLYMWACQGCGARWGRIGEQQQQQQQQPPHHNDNNARGSNNARASSSSNQAGAQYPIAPVGNPTTPFNEVPVVHIADSSDENM